MRDKQIERLKEILAIPTFFRQEHEVLRYLIKYLRTTDYIFDVDDYGNLYVTKGKATVYPCVCAHTDSVHEIDDIKIVKTVGYNGKERLQGVHPKTGNGCGIGADDKAGVFVCLELLDKLPVLKVVFFASEEYGCVGSYNSDPEFFKNVGYVMEFDCPGYNEVTFTCNGIQLFNPKNLFYQRMLPILHKIMGTVPVLRHHPYTDVWRIKSRHNISCINIATGYYRYHTISEYVIIDHVLNAVQIGLESIQALGNKRYKYTHQNQDQHPYDGMMKVIKAEYPYVFEAEQKSYKNLLTE